MTHQVLSVAMSFGERTVYAGKMLLIGLGTVFLALIALWGALVLFRRLITREAPAAPAKKPAPAPAPVAPVAAAPAPAAPAADHDALIAVITAAVAAAMAEENGGVSPNFRVVSFRKL